MLLSPGCVLVDPGILDMYIAVIYNNDSWIVFLIISPASNGIMATLTKTL
jgi:hypothetical protein